MSQAKLYLFGPPRLELNGQQIGITLRKAQALLAYLAATGQSYSREALATLFWPEANPRMARANLRRMLYDIGHRLESDLLVATPETVAIDWNIGLWVDIAMFKQLAAKGLGTPSQIDLLQTAVDLYQDDFMAGFNLNDCPEFDEWQFFQREELRQIFVEVLQQLVHIYEDEENYEQALHHARRWLTFDSLHEPVHRLLMKFYALIGQQSAAMRQYDECVRILDEELGVLPEEETTSLFQEIRSRRFPNIDRSPSVIKSSILKSSTKIQQTDISRYPEPTLPKPPTSFVGREQELGEILSQIHNPACRLLTLVGPGGIGKTRLAIEVAHRTLNGASSDVYLFNDGVYFVPLQPLTATSAIPSAIAEAIDFHFHSGAPAQQQLVDYLQTKRMLLVLDNFEHLLDGTDLVMKILAGASSTTLLVTSRESLNLREEWFHSVAGMQYAALSSKNTQAETEHVHHDANQLFIQRAKQVNKDFTADENSPQITRICQMVDGMPLAIELAAAWLKMMSLSEVMAELEHSLDILTTQYRNIPERHRSMRIVLEQSWQLLAPSEQSALMRLSVFRGGFLREAGEKIASGSLPIFAALLEKSLIRREGNRYQLHELLRQFVGEKLAERGEIESQTRDQHSIYYLHFLIEHEEMLLGREQQASLDRIQREIENIRVGWMWAVQQESLVPLSQAVDGFYWAHMIPSHYQELLELFVAATAVLQKAIQVQDSSPAQNAMTESTLSKFLAYTGTIYHNINNYAKAQVHAQQAIAMENSPRSMALAYRVLSSVEMDQGRRTEAEAYANQSLALCRTDDDQYGISESLEALSIIAVGYGNYAQARQLVQDALDIARHLERPNWIAQLLVLLGWSTNCLGLYGESETHWQESLEICRSIGDERGIARVINFLGWASWCKGHTELSKAVAYHEEAVEILRGLGNHMHLSMVLGDLGLVYNDLGEFEQAKTLCTEGLAIAREYKSPMFISYNLVGLSGATTGLGDFVASLQQLREGIRLTHQSELIPQCLMLLYQVAALLWEEGQHQALEPADALQSNKKALQQTYLLVQHPFTYPPFKDRAKQLRDKIESILPTHIIAEAQASVDNITLDTVVEDILTEPE